MPVSDKYMGFLVYLPPSMHAKVKARAVAMGVSASELVRRSVGRFMEGTPLAETDRKHSNYSVDAWMEFGRWQTFRCWEHGYICSDPLCSAEATRCSVCGGLGFWWGTFLENIC